MIFKAFEWDKENVEHVLRHNVFPDEVEEACVNKPHVRRTIDKRYLTQTLQKLSSNCQYQAAFFNTLRRLSKSLLTASLPLIVSVSLP